jgi:hypothetical protein
LFFLRRMVCEIIVAFLGTLPHDRHPESLRCCCLAVSRGKPLVLASRSTLHGIYLAKLPTSVNGARLAAQHPPQGSGNVQTQTVWSPNINGVSIAYGSRPQLRPDYPAAECRAAEPSDFRCGGFSPPLSLLMPTFALVVARRVALPRPLHSPHDAPLPLFKRTVLRFGDGQLQPFCQHLHALSLPLRYYTASTAQILYYTHCAAGRLRQALRRA